MRSYAIFAVGLVQATPDSAPAIASIQDRVVRAGGNPKGLLSASLSWWTPDDLDLHVVAPGEEISWRQRKVGSGTLDVDMCVSGRKGSVCTARPVENVVFDDLPVGRFKVYVQNYRYHSEWRETTKDAAVDILQGSRSRGKSRKDRLLEKGTARRIAFEVLLQVRGEHTLVSGVCTPLGAQGPPSDVAVFEFTVLPGGALAIDSQATPDADCNPFRLDGPAQVAESGRSRPSGAAS